MVNYTHLTRNFNCINHVSPGRILLVNPFWFTSYCLLPISTKIWEPSKLFLPCLLLSSILWDSTWTISDPAPYRCAHYLQWERNCFSPGTHCLCHQCVHTWIHTYMPLCVLLRKITTEWAQFKDCLRAVTLDSLWASLCTLSLPLILFKSRCHVLIFS